MNTSPDNKKNKIALQDLKKITVNSEVITPVEIIQEMQHHQSDSQDDSVKKSSEVLIIQLLFLQKAKELELDKDLLKDTESSLEETIIGRLINEKIPKSDNISEDDCQKYYDSNIDTFLTKQMLELKHILISPKQQDKCCRADAKKLAISLIAKLKKSIDLFESLVAKHSTCPSKKTGGSLGRVGRGQTPPEFEKVVFGLQEGLHENPVESDFGFHVVHIDKIIPPKQLEYEQVKGDIADMLIEVGHRIELSKYTHQLINDADINGYDFTASSSD